LMAGEGCRVRLASIPTQLLGPRFDPELARRTIESGMRAAREFRAGASASSGGSLEVENLANPAGLEQCLDRAEIVAAAGPAGLRLLPLDSWSTRKNVRWLLDFNLTEPLGIEGLKPADDFADYGGKRGLGALAIGNPKMKVHKACIAKLFERNNLVLDTDGVYSIAKQLI